VAATANDISFDPRVLGLDPSACSINPAIGKSLLASVVQDDASRKTLRIFVSSTANADPIPDGALYSCTFTVAPSAPPGTYQIANSTILAYAPDGTQLNNVVGANGSVTVALVVMPSPTPTPTIQLPPATPMTYTVVVGPEGRLAFSPRGLSINVGDTVQWTWSSSGHSVVSGSACIADNQFCSPDDSDCAGAPLSSQGATYSHTFTAAGTYPYFCSQHCGLGMAGMISVR
jgi:plastocyanin